jgi:hypothetical protein
MGTRHVIGLLVCVTLLLLPSTVSAQASAQASITGVARDTSGGVLPGVTVEASSPALIERVRTVVTDGSGLYRIVDLPPGTYAVTFTLPGFVTFRRADVVLAGAFTATVNAEMPLGGLEQTIVVSGETPTVDIQSARHQAVVEGDILKVLPTARASHSLLTLVPGLTYNNNNVGGINGPVMSSFGAHGGPGQEGRLQVDGISVGAAIGGSGFSGYLADIANSQEASVTLSGALGEAEVGGPVISIVPKTGGNTYSGSYFTSIASEGLQSNNITEAVAEAGLRLPDALIRDWDMNAAFGGPILRDRLWFFTIARHQGNRKFITNMWANKNAGVPGATTYEPDFDRPAKTGGTWKNASLRLTWQATPRNKLTVFWDEQMWCNACAFGGGGPTTSPEAATTPYNDPTRVKQATWNAPVTNRLLLEAAYSFLPLRWGSAENWVLGNNRGIVRMQELAGAIPGITYGSQNWSDNYMSTQTWQASASYVSGAHNMKFGYQGAYYLDNQTSFTNDHRLLYQFRNGEPTSVQMFISAFTRRNRTAYTAFYAQEQYTIRRLTLQGALRYDRAWSYSPAQQVGPDRWLPNPLHFAHTKGVTGLHDLSPRFGTAYDLFGTGRTALKFNMGRYLAPATNGGRYTAMNPANRVSTTTTRSWTDTNGNMTPDCDLLVTGFTGECGPMTNQNFGQEVFGVTYDSDILGGWAVRPADWQIGVSVQQEVMPRVSAQVSYNRRWWGNVEVTENRVVTSNDFDSFNVTAPSDPRLPAGGGYVIENLFNVSPEKFGQVDNFVTNSANVARRVDYWHGVDVHVTARILDGVRLQGGTSTGRRVLDTCDLRAMLPETALTNSHCREVLPFQTQVRGFGSYTIPKVDVMLSGIFQYKPGLPLNANWLMPGAEVEQSLGRPLSGGARFVSVNLLQPGDRFGDSVKQIDLKIAKVVRLGRTRANLGLDVYNVTNSGAVIGYNQSYSPTTDTWLTPTSVLPARFARLSLQFDF